MYIQPSLCCYCASEENFFLSSSWRRKECVALSLCSYQTFQPLLLLPLLHLGRRAREETSRKEASTTLYHESKRKRKKRRALPDSWSYMSCLFFSCHRGIESAIYKLGRIRNTFNFRLRELYHFLKLVKLFKNEALENEGHWQTVSASTTNFSFVRKWEIFEN